jgi:hypothetical protein
MQPGDNVVLLMIIVIIGIAVFMALRRRLGRPLHRGAKFIPDDEIPVTEAVALLENAGYQVMTMKRRIPLKMIINDEEELESRFFVDHFVQNEQEWFIVKVARPRKPLEMTGSSIRDQLLPYQLMYPDAAGVLYVDVDLQKIVKVQFEVEL